MTYVVQHNLVFRFTESKQKDKTFWTVCNTHYLSQSQGTTMN